jgi:histidine phosphotransfer protein HptB
MMIDWMHVNELRADMGDGFDELVEVFLEEMDSAIAALDPAADPSTVSASLHFLKGAALNLGFRDFAALCDQGELRADQGGQVDHGPVHAVYAQSRAAFVEGLSRGRLQPDCPLTQENSPVFRPA